MGAKQKKKIVDGIEGVNDWLAKIAIQNGILIHEVKLMRKMFTEHVMAQQSLVKEWMKKDLDHHYKDNKATMAAVKAINGNERKVEPV